MYRHIVDGLWKTRHFLHDISYIQVLYVDFSDIFFLNSIDDLLLLEGRGLDFPRKEEKRARLEIWKNFFSPSEKERKYRRRRGGREFRATTAHAPLPRIEASCPLGISSPGKTVKTLVLASEETVWITISLSDGESLRAGTQAISPDPGGWGSSTGRVSIWRIN